MVNSADLAERHAQIQSIQKFWKFALSFGILSLVPITMYLLMPDTVSKSVMLFFSVVSSTMLTTGAIIGLALRLKLKSYRADIRLMNQARINNPASTNTLNVPTTLMRPPSYEPPPSYEQVINKI